MPKISIIIPVYNTRTFLDKCLTSVVKQTIQDLEIICINDGSTDKSLDIINKYAKKDPRIKVIDITNHGVSFARNLGIEKATGEFIIFIDSDDYVEKTYCELMLKCQKDKAVDLAFCGHYTKTTDGRLRGQWLPNILYSRYPVADRNKITKYLVVTKKLFKTSIIKEHNLRFDTTLHYAEDSLFLVQYLTHCNTIGGVRRYLYTDVINAKSLCRNAAYKERRKLNLKKSFDLINKIVNEYNKTHV